MLFAGDPLSFIARHHFPAAMHRPDGLLMASHAPKRRLSMPFFLYCDADAVLEVAKSKVGLQIPQIGKVQVKRWYQSADAADRKLILDALTERG